MTMRSQKDAGDAGQFADRPREIPIGGWWRVLRRVQKEMVRDNLSIVAAGVAFYSFLATFPALAAVATVYGFLVDPSEIEAQLEPVRPLLPPQAYDIVASQLGDAARGAKAELSIGLILSLLFAFWSAAKGAKALLAALNIAYEETEQRGLVAGTLASLLFTVGGIVFAALSLALIGVLPAVVALLPLGGIIATGLLLLRWPLMAVLLMVGLALLYRYGPHRRSARLRWITPGAVVATVLVILGSIGFSFYVSSFGNYNETFGSLGAVVVLLMWFYLSAYVVCLGAELNAELEHHTHSDTTVGPSRPKGQRGAWVADHTADII